MHGYFTNWFAGTAIAAALAPSIGNALAEGRRAYDLHIITTIPARCGLSDVAPRGIVTGVLDNGAFFGPVALTKSVHVECNVPYAIDAVRTRTRSGRSHAGHVSGKDTADLTLALTTETTVGALTQTCDTAAMDATAVCPLVGGGDDTALHLPRSDVRIEAAWRAHLVAESLGETDALVPVAMTLPPSDADTDEGRGVVDRVTVMFGPRVSSRLPVSPLPISLS